MPSRGCCQLFGNPARAVSAIEALSLAHYLLQRRNKANKKVNGVEAVYVFKESRKMDIAGAAVCEARTNSVCLAG